MTRRDLILMIVVISITFFGVMYITTDAAHADLFLEGWGTEEANGCYIDQEDGTWNNGTYDIYSAGIEGVDMYCRIGTIDPETQLYYGQIGTGEAAVPCSEANAQTVTWLVDTGESPAGTVVAGCEAPPEPPATTTASTTIINNPNQDMFNGFLIFFMAWFGLMWMFRRPS